MCILYCRVLQRHVAPPQPSRMMNGRKPTSGRGGESTSAFKPGTDNLIRPVQHCVIIEEDARELEELEKEAGVFSPAVEGPGGGSSANSPLLRHRPDVGAHMNPILPSTSRGEIVDACDNSDKNASQTIFPIRKLSSSSVESGRETGEPHVTPLVSPSIASYPMTSSAEASSYPVFVKAVEVTPVNPSTLSIPAASVVLASQQQQQLSLATIPENTTSQTTLPTISEHSSELNDEDLAPEIGHVHIIGLGDHPSDSSIQSLNVPSQSPSFGVTPAKENPIVMYLQEASSAANQIPKIPMTSHKSEPMRTRRPTAHYALPANRLPPPPGFEPYRPSLHMGSMPTWTSSSPVSSGISQIRPVRGPMRPPLTTYSSPAASGGDNPRGPDTLSPSSAVVHEAQSPDVNRRQNPSRVVHLTREDILSSKLSIYDNVQYVYHGDQVQKPGSGQRHQFSF